MRVVLLLHIFKHLSFVCNTHEVIGELNGIIILPCSFTPGKDEVIHWNIADNKEQVVHRYYDGKDMLEGQETSYAGRTSLFLDQIRNGNASLQIRNLLRSDEKKYFCYVSTQSGSNTVIVQLKVEATVWGEQHKNVTIPCSFNPGEDVVIHWWITNNQSRVVHKYFYKKDMLNEQDKNYKKRTSLILSELSKGNASLQIRDVQKSDENSYSCYVATRTERMQNKMKLNVADFGHSIEYALDHGQLDLKCASNAYPSDTVTIEWYEGTKKIQQDNKTSSSCTSCNSKNNSYNCIIRHSLVQNTWTGIWKTNVPEQGNIKCTCSFCRTGSTEVSVRLDMWKNGTQVPVDANRIQKVDEHSQQINNLTVKDNGDYVCEIRTSDQKLIVLTSVNMTDAKESLQRNRLFILLPLVLVIFLFSVICVFYKKKE